MKKIVCAYSKNTGGMYRWDKMEGNVPLEIYIPIWRVPDPCPPGRK